MNQTPLSQTNAQIGIRTSVVTLVANVLLTIFKLIAGIIGHSSAMLSDAVHSFSDVFSTVIVIIGIRAAGKEADDDHQYGHERFECVAAILLSGALLATGIGIGYGGVKALIAGDYGSLATPGVVALVAAITSIVLKEAMYWYTRAAAKRTNSDALMADAWHHRSDALSSIGSFAGILGARMGLAFLDPLASVIICLFIIKVAYDIFRNAIRKMTDAAADEETVAAIEQVIREQEGVLGIDALRTRLFADRIYVDVSIRADGTLPLREAHEIASAVHHRLEERFEAIKHCNVHVNPD